MSATTDGGASEARLGEVRLGGAPLSETQERFLRDAAQRLPLDRVVELHLFPPLRQGGTEMGIAVIAARHETPPPDLAADVTAEAEVAAEAAPGHVAPSPAAERLTVFSARYRLTLKGPDRGRWEVEVVEEADAPLVSVDAVVRGVQRRVGEGAEPERLTAAQLGALLAERGTGSAPPAASAVRG